MTYYYIYTDAWCVMLFLCIKTLITLHIRGLADDDLLKQRKDTEKRKQYRIWN